MKKLFLFLILSFCLKIYAQDLIITKNKDSLRCYITDLNENFIFYKMTEQSDNYRSMAIKFVDTFFFEENIQSMVIVNKISKPILDSIGSLRTEEYCMIMGYGRIFTNTLSISIDFGQFRSVWNSTDFLKNTDGKKIIFNSMIDALNYMNGFGWEFVNAYTITKSNQNVYHWVLKRKIIKK